ncbi:MAG: DUF1947 domain-containing protein [Nanoarchaeota archaeon]
MRHLSNKEKKQINNKLPKGYTIDKKDEIKVKENIYFKGDEPYLIEREGKLLPHLKSIPETEYKSVYVDHGAIPFIAKGADLMRPGIQKIDEGISKDDVIMIKEEVKHKTIALGISMLDSQNLKKQEKGKSVIVYHYVGDEFY